ncbi:hypothetical protein KFE98_04965 [bacterium SCSIO 12741]|nr:hypothetical protein KFE98_04965 [bacterium SCSIO 12741]
MSVLNPIKVQLDKVISQYGPFNDHYILDFCIGSDVALQVIHPMSIERPEFPADNFGLVVYVPFDLDDPNQVSEYEIFKSLNLYNEFFKYEWEGILCYAKDFGSDSLDAAGAIAVLLQLVYGLTDFRLLRSEIHST